MLVITLRTVTSVALWRWTSSCTIWSVVVCAAANLSFSQRRAGVVSGSWSRRRWASWTAKAADQGA